MRLVSCSSYLPEIKVENKEIANKFNIEDEYIVKRTGIKQRYFAKDETIEEMATIATQSLIKNAEIDVQEIGLIVVATTSTNRLMPGIANYVQKKINIKKCIAFDVLAGCSGYINAVDIAQMYIDSGKIEKAIVIGVDILSKYTNQDDINTAIIFADGAGTILFENSNNNSYFSNIESIPDFNNILFNVSNSKISMDGLAIYKYAVTETVKSVRELLEKSGEKLEDIKYIVPHQSNFKIINAIANRLGISMDKVFTNIDKVGNTFCASIPIALEEMQQNELLNNGDKIILLGYGGGLNTGSVLIEI